MVMLITPMVLVSMAVSAIATVAVAVPTIVAALVACTSCKLGDRHGQGASSLRSGRGRHQVQQLAAPATVAVLIVVTPVVVAAMVVAAVVEAAMSTIVAPLAAGAS